MCAAQDRPTGPARLVDLLATPPAFGCDAFLGGAASLIGHGGLDQSDVDKSVRHIPQCINVARRLAEAAGHEDLADAHTIVRQRAELPIE